MGNTKVEKARRKVKKQTEPPEAVRTILHDAQEQHTLYCFIYTFIDITVSWELYIVCKRDE